MLRVVVSRPEPLSIAGLFHLLVIYVVWGSTYLAIRVAVRPEAGWGPFWLGASRVGLAAAVLLGTNAVLRRRLWPRRGEMWVVAISGTLMWVGGNGGVNWAEQRVDSGVVALVIGTMPLWVALMEAAIDRRPPSWTLGAALAAGFAGLAVLTWPMLEDGFHADAVGVTVVVFGTVAWGVGTILLSRRPVGSLNPTVISGWQQAFGAIGFTALAVTTAESTPAPTPLAWWAWAYLVVFGSLLAFSSFVHAVRLLPTSIVMTYTFVNPVIAVVLGWAILDEPITSRTVAGMVLVLAGVWGVFRDRGRRRGG